MYSSNVEHKRFGHESQLKWQLVFGLVDKVNLFKKNVSGDSEDIFLFFLFLIKTNSICSRKNVDDPVNVAIKEKNHSLFTISSFF